MTSTWTAPEKSVKGRPSLTVSNGKVVSTSVSALEKFDSSQEGCELRWHLKEVQGWSEPQRNFNSAGDIAHEQLEHYLVTGENVLGKIPLAGFHLLPPPGPPLKVEWGLNRKPHPPRKPNGKKVNYFPAHESLLWAGGVPLIGFVDVEDPNEYHVLPDGTWLHEPLVVEILDHKTSSSAQYAKTPDGLLKTHQMSGYGKFIVERPEYEHIEAVRLSQNYYLTKPPPAGAPRAFKRTILVSRLQLEEAWYSTEAIVDRMKSVAGEKDERRVSGNLAACGNYGGCPHREHCWQYRAQSPSEKLRMSLLKKQSPTNPEANAMTTNGTLLNKVRGLAPVGAPTNGALPPGLSQQLTAKESINGAGYKFSTGAVGMFLGATEQNGQVVYSFQQVDPATGKATGAVFPVAPAEPVEMVFQAPVVTSAPSGQLAGPPPPTTAPPTNPTTPGLPPWSGTAAGAPLVSATTGGLRRLTPLPLLPGEVIAQQPAAAPAGPPAPPALPTGAAPARRGLKKAETAAAAVATAPVDPAARAQQVQAALEGANGMLTTLFGIESPSVENTIALAALLLG